MTQPIERAVARDLEQPRFRIGGHAAKRPLLHRGHQRVLHRVFGKRQVPRAERARQGCDHLSRLPAEQMINKCDGIVAGHCRNCSKNRCNGVSPRYK
jgi:hypothetical protein